MTGTGNSCSSTFSVRNQQPSSKLKVQSSRKVPNPSHLRDDRVPGVNEGGTDPFTSTSSSVNFRGFSLPTLLARSLRIGL